MPLAESKLIPIAPPDFDVVLDLRYATHNNFTEKPVYTEPHCYLHLDAAEKLLNSINLAASIGLKLKLFDAFRPREAQYRLWEHTPNPEFLANPDKGSPHSRGVAIDLTLVDSANNELEMGTEFDAFTPLSHHGNDAISSKIQPNRFLLLGLMTTAGWDYYQNEWWHYQLFDAKSYPLLSDKDAGTGMM